MADEKKPEPPVETTPVVITVPPATIGAKGT
jgi:hypothetical protein